jgi:hypothetical protein
LVLVEVTAKKKTTKKCAKFPFCSKAEAAYGLETMITVITVIDSPSYVVHPYGRFVVVVVVGIFPGLSPSLCVVATSEWPNRDRLTAVNPSQVVAGT